MFTPLPVSFELSSQIDFYQWQKWTFVEIEVNFSQETNYQMVNLGT